jgi:hypothetical protein
MMSAAEPPEAEQPTRESRRPLCLLAFPISILGGNAMQETNLIEQDQPVGAILSPVPAPAPTMTLCSYGTKLTREELARVATPAATATHKPIPHIAVVEKLIEALGFRQIGVVREEYAVSADGMRMFGVMDLSSGFAGCRFDIGLRNSHDKSFRLSCTVGLRVFVCENLAFHGEYTHGTMFLK